MKINTYPGKLIVIDGLDGSGQSTQISLLKDFLEGKGFKVLSTKEPTLDSEAGKRIRNVLDKKEQIESAELQKLFVQDRREHLDNVIIPALKENKIVLLDRYSFSTLAYGKAEGLDLDWLIELNRDFLLPDLTFFLKVAAQVCVKRIEERGKEKTLFEKEEKLEQAWQNYLLLPSLFDNINVIEGEDSKEEVSSRIIDIVAKKLDITI